MDPVMIPPASIEPLQPFLLQSEAKEVSKDSPDIVAKDVMQIRAWLLGGILLLVPGTLLLVHSYIEKNANCSFFVALCFYLFSLASLMTGCVYVLNMWFRLKSRSEIAANVSSQQKKSVCFYKFIRQIFCSSPESSDFRKVVSDIELSKI